MHSDLPFSSRGRTNMDIKTPNNSSLLRNIDYVGVKLCNLLPLSIIYLNNLTSSESNLNSTSYKILANLKLNQSINFKIFICESY